MGEHTRGPWMAAEKVTGKNRNGRQWTVVAADKHGPVALVYVSWPPEEAAANAHVLASAPDLLDALKEMLDWHLLYHGGDDCVLCVQAKAALARAEPEETR